tara:strand:+ start:222362 stop:224512 length:2151 start_codon:yes stop_codon:yes gene_type:complete
MKKIGLWLPWLVLSLFVFAYQQQIPLVEDLRFSTFDGYQKTFPRADVDLPVYVIDIDEKSLEEIGQWPWPRNILAQLVEKSFALGVKSLGFDMVFPEKDGKSPEVVQNYWSQSESIRQALNGLPAHDTLFAEALSKYPVVKGFVASFQKEGGVSKGRPPLQSSSVIQGLKDQTHHLMSGQVAVRNIPIIESASPYHGNFSYYFDTDSSLVRGIHLLIQGQGGVFPSLSAETLRLYAGAKDYTVGMGEKGLKTVTIEPFEAVPVAADGRYTIYYRPFNRTRYISAVDVLKERDTAKVLNGGIALVGTSAAGLYDLRSTPLNPVVPGVESHVQVIENIMLGTHIQRPVNGFMVEMATLVILGFLLIIGVQRLGAAMASVLYLLALGVVVAGCFYQFKVNGLLYDWSYAALTLTAVFLVQSLVKYAQEKSSRLAIRSAFAHYLSPDLVKIVSKDPSKLKLGGEDKEITVLFSDIRGFTSMSEGLTPNQLTRVLNRYLTPMTEIVQKNEGTIDKYMGDAVMAFWNAPLDVESHAQKACKAALDMLTGLKELNIRLKSEGLPEIEIGIGVNTDVVTVGNMGSDQRFDYTVMGDGVNLGARLEGQCKTYGVPLIISESTLKALGDVSALYLDKVAVKGKTEGVNLYHLISLEKPQGEIAQKIGFAKQAVSAFQSQEWENARELFKNELIPLKMRLMYIERIDSLQATQVPSDWDGTYHATSK